MAPVQSKPADLFDKVWQFDLAQDLISIGWSKLGDITAKTREELAEAIAIAYPEKPAAARGLFTNMLWAFYHEMLPGDYVIARRGRKALAGVGRIRGAASFSPGKNQYVGHSGFLDVAWQAEPRDKTFPSIVFPMHTLAEFSEEKFRSVVEGSPPILPSPEADPEVEDPSEFVLEKYLEDFIVSNFNSIFKGRMRVFEDAEGNDGQQYATEVGPIDILAIEEQTNSFVVIELKKGRPSDRVVGQILRYMGWVKMNLCQNGQPVKGLVICRDYDTKLAYALEMTNDIDVRYYSVSFKLKESP